MAYQARFSRSARRQLRGLSRESANRVRQRVEQLKQTPRGRWSKQLQGRPIRWSSRVGDLRIVYLIDDASESINVQAIGNRDQIYDLMRRS